jgi:hypothetical protein
MTDYEAERCRVQIIVPERFNPVLDIVERWACDAADDLALVSLDGAGCIIANQSRRISLGNHAGPRAHC